MTAVPSRPSRAVLYLRLGRVSNLPTVWTNTLAGVVLAGGALDALTVLRLSTAASLFYVGGMFLNDAFDREIDARERPERPIPSGLVSPAEVFAVGFCLFGVALGVLALNAAARHEAATPALAAGGVLAALIVLYDAWHKQNPLSPVVMGACRGAVYVLAGVGAGGAFPGAAGSGPGPSALVVGALVVGAYVVGLTFVARQENRKSYRAGATLALLASPIGFAFSGSLGVVGGLLLVVFAAWIAVALKPLFYQEKPNVGASVVRLIAGVSLVDALAIATHGAPGLGLVAVGGLGVTLALQRFVRGT